MRIYILPDSTGWALDNVATALIKYMPQHSFKKRKLTRRITARAARKHDVVFVMYPIYLQEFYEQSGHFIAGVNSFVELDVHDPEKDRVPDKHKRLLERFRRIGVPCKMLQEYLADNGIEAYHTPYGIDADLFHPMSAKQRDPLVFGFAGHPTLHGNDVKGYAEFIKPVFDSVEGVEFRTALGGDKQVPHSEMIHFYNSIDVLVCMSRSETGPLPVLEAMSCGVPVISTKVGLVPEVVEHGKSGVIVEREEAPLRMWVEYLRDNPQTVKDLGREALESAEKFAYPNVVSKWDAFFKGE